MRKELFPDPTAGRHAREALNGWLSADVGEPVAQQVRTAASELVTNVVRHGRLEDTDRIQLSCSVDDEVVRVEVEQPSSAASARLIPAGERPPTSGGLGLRIVDGFASSWGVEEGPPGRVWFEVQRQAGGRAA
jgi:anti-sigma regulatory factor (Ser/Thr protein kinase)